MAEKGIQIAEDSDDSDDSMEGKRPTFSAEERNIAHDLQMNSNEFIKRYEEHEGDLQKIIECLKKNSETFLDKYRVLTEENIEGVKSSAIGAGAGAAAAGLLLAPFTGGLSLLVAAGAGGAVGSAYGASQSYTANKNKQEAGNELLEDIENSLKNFKQNVGIISSSLNNICDHLKEIQQYQKCKHPLQLQREAGRLRQYARDLSELAERFKQEDLHKLLEQGTRTLSMPTNFNSLLEVLLSWLGVLFVLEDSRTLRDFEKLKRHSIVQEKDLESKAGKFICKLREITTHCVSADHFLLSSCTDAFLSALLVLSFI
ncbi:uncharacterized protein LOC143517632 [Brachyhypopomus gauderio]|uniref:uncharacterized protein LOC143517632 n=1 Tax=Brachyhypopomus gauderio TaxID=698409 RepID=UPI0040436AAF